MQWELVQENARNLVEIDSDGTRIKKDAQKYSTLSCQCIVINISFRPLPAAGEERMKSIWEYELLPSTWWPQVNMSGVLQ